MYWGLHRVLCMKGLILSVTIIVTVAPLLLRGGDGGGGGDVVMRRAESN